MASPRKKKQTTKKPVNTKLALAVFVPLGIVVLFGGGLFAYGTSFSGKLLPGVIVAGIDLGGKTADEARAILQREAERYNTTGVKVALASKVLTPTASDVGLTIDVDRTLSRALAVGRENTFRKTFQVPSIGKRADLTMVVDLDIKVLASYLTTTEKGQSVAMINPHLVWENNAYRVVEGSAGMRVVHGDFAEDLLRSAERQTPYTIRLSYETVNPTIAGDNLAGAQAKMETMTAAPLTLTYQWRRYPVDSQTLKTWVRQEYDDSLVTNDPLRGIVVTMDKPVVSAYLGKLNTKIGIPPKQTFGYDAPQHGEYAYKNSEGREIKIPETSDAILASLQPGETRKAEVVIGTVDPILTLESVQAPRSTGKVITVDIVKQAVYAYENGKLVFWTRASTGKGDSTKVGEWRVYAKSAVQVMAGPGYYLPHVRWVLAYNGDYTIHGTYWHTKFGQPMSHGCTNLSEPDAKWFFDWAPIGTPVVIYRSAR